MQTIFSLFYILICVITLSYSINQELVENVTSIYNQDEIRVLKYLKNIESKNLITLVQQQKHFNVRVLNKTSNAKVEQSIEQFQVPDGVKMNKPIYITFNEKERHDGFKRTVPNDNPYAVLIIVNTSHIQNVGLCSGTLLTRHCVLTAAHCFNVNVVDMISVYAGVSSMAELKSNTLPSYSQLRKSKTFYNHPSYNPAKGYEMMYDVAVVKVTEAFKMTSTVNIVPLTKTPWPINEYYQDCMFTGFGIVYLGKKDTDDYTRKTSYFEVMSNCPCFNGTDRDDVVVCSRPREDYGLCRGDSGGGLICNGEVVAVASTILFVEDIESCDFRPAINPDCGLKNTLSVFQKADPYLDWINSKLNKASTDHSCHIVIIVIPVLLYIVYQNTF